MASRCQTVQQGAVMVEFAISVSLFLLVALGIIEFAMLVFDMSRANELTRGLSRMAITADPVCDIWGSECGPLVCPGGIVTVSLSDVDTSAPSGNASAATGYRMLQRAQQLLPDIEASQIEVVYSCSNTGNPLRPQPVPLVTVRLQNYTRNFLLPGFLGLNTGFGFPAFEVTRLGEDLYTEG